MGDMVGIGEVYKALHKQRVAKNPDRIAYAIEQLEKHNIEYVVKNEQTGHFHCRRKSDDALIQFWAGTGKIMGYQNLRGIHNLIKICTSSKSTVSDKIHLR